MTVIKALVCGGRDFDDREAVFAALDEVKPLLVIHGGARGADSLAGQWAAERCVLARTSSRGVAEAPAHPAGRPPRWSAGGDVTDEDVYSELLELTGAKVTESLRDAARRMEPSRHASVNRARALIVTAPNGPGEWRALWRAWGLLVAAGDKLKAERTARAKGRVEP